MFNLLGGINVDALLENRIAVKAFERTEPARRTAGTQLTLLSVAKHLEQIRLICSLKGGYARLREHSLSIGQIPTISGQGVFRQTPLQPEHL